MNAQTQAKDNETVLLELNQPLPYQPSYLDRFMGFIARLPFPYWLTYLLLFLLEASLIQLLAWVDGWLPVFTISPILITYPLWLWGALAIMTYLDAISVEALTHFAPLLNLQEDQIDRLKAEFTSMPMRSVIVSGVLWVIVFLIFVKISYNAFYVSNQIGLWYTGFHLSMGMISFFTGSVIYYHSLRQLRLVNRTVKLVRQFDLFQLDPVYAFSRVTSQTGLVWVFLLSLTLLTFPIELAAVLVLSVLVVQVVLALAAFVLPLWIVHHRLELEKRSLLAGVNGRMKSTLLDQHQAMDQNDYDKLSQLNGVMASLKGERELLLKIPTWPWRAGSLTGFLSAITLPIIIFLLQRLLGKVLGG